MPDKSAFADLLAAGKPVVIDGGLATQLEAMGHDLSGPLWSAGIIQSDPRAIIDAHRAYLDAGARIIASASYQASRMGCAALGMSAAEADALILRSVDLAETARGEFLADNPDAPRPLIAASIGPYGAALHDGSEYRGDYRVVIRRLLAFHKPTIELLDASSADLIACETIPSYMECQVLSELLQHIESPAWVSFCCKDDKHLSDDTPVSAAAQLFHDHFQVLALGVNCTAPENVVSLIREIRTEAPRKAIIAYPNSGESWDGVAKTWSGDRSGFDPESVSSWIASGAQLVGGCCRVGPEEIRAISAGLGGSPRPRCSLAHPSRRRPGACRHRTGTAGRPACGIATTRAAAA